MAIATAEWVVMALGAVLTIGGLYFVYVKGYRRRETEHVHQLKTKASTLREFENDIKEMYNARERKQLTDLTLSFTTLENGDVSDEEVERIMVSTPHSVQQENLYGIGWYKTLHRTRSRQGQSLESQAISVIHPGDLVYIEATALWKNRIRGKLGKNAAGWLTMEDVDRKKVFVEKTKPPPKHETRAREEEEIEELVQNIISPLKMTIKKIESDSEEKQRESDSEQQAPISKPKPGTPVDTEYEHIMEVEIPEIPKKKKKRKPRTIEIEEERRPQRHVKESHRWKQKTDRRHRREKEKYQNIHTEEFGVPYNPVNREKLEEEIYLALRKRRKDRERRKKQRSSHLFTHHVVTHHLMPDLDSHEEPHHLDVIDDVLFDGGGILDEILDEYGAKWEAGRFRQESREEGETQKTRRRKKRDPRQRRHAPRHRADTVPARAKHHHNRHRADTDYVRHLDQHHNAEYYTNHDQQYTDQQYTANFYYPMYDMQPQQHWGADQAVWDAHYGHGNGDRRYDEYILE